MYNLYVMNMDNEIKEFLDYCLIEKKLSKNTIETYRNDLKKYSNYFNKNIDSITKDDFYKFIEFMKKDNLSEKTINHIIGTVKNFHSYFSIHYDKPNKLENIERLKMSKTLPKVLTIEEVNKLLDIKCITSFDYRNKAMLELMYSSGLRISELLSLCLTDIDLHNNIVKVFGKGAKERIIPIGDYATLALEKYINEYRNSLIKKGRYTDILFLNNHGNKMSRSGFFKIIQKIADDCGIKKELSPHTLRHSFATHMLMYGADLRSIQELLGHENMSTTSIYTHLGNNELRDNYDKYHPRS